MIEPTLGKPNKPKAAPVLLLLILMPLIAPAYLLGILCALIHAAAFCGYKNTEGYFLEGLGFETTEQTVERLISERIQ